MTDTILWISPVTGTEVDLTDLVHYKVRNGLRGILLPPRTLVEVPTPNYDGGRHIGQHIESRTVNVPLRIKGSSRAAMAATLASLAYYLTESDDEDSPSAGQLAVTIGADTWKLNCRYSGGLEGVTMAPAVEYAELVFRAVDDVWWFSGTESEVMFAEGGVDDWFPWVPLELGIAIYSQQTITVPGTKSAWPVWYITGPGAGLRLKNNTTGKELRLEYTIGAGEVITVLTGKTATFGNAVVSSSVGSIYRYLTDSSELWPLVVGDNEIEIGLTGTDSNSLVRLTYAARAKTGLG